MHRPLYDPRVDPTLHHFELKLANADATIDPLNCDRAEHLEAENQRLLTAILAHYATANYGSAMGQRVRDAREWDRAEWANPHGGPNPHDGDWPSELDWLMCGLPVLASFLSSSDSEPAAAGLLRLIANAQLAHLLTGLS